MEQDENVPVADNAVWKENNVTRMKELEKHKPQAQRKRAVLGNLSNNACLHSSHQLTKPESLQSQISNDGGYCKSKNIYIAPSRQPFTVYDEQSNTKIPWPSLNVTVCSEGTSLQQESEIGQDCRTDKFHQDDSACGFARNDHTEYETEIHNYLKQAEQRYRLKRDFMSGQTMVNKSMRAILVDWLVEVAEEYHLVPDTLYLTVNYVDRFLSRIVVEPSKLQLVGVACMLIASKIEEIYPPEISEFVYITNSTYTNDEVRQMETVVLKVLSFDMVVPTPLLFLDRYEKLVDLSEEEARMCSCLTNYYCELTLQDAEIQWKHLPSAVAASALLIAVATLGKEYSISRLANHTGFELAILVTCINDVLHIISNAGASKLQGIKEKYSEPRFLCVARLGTRQPILSTTTC